MQEKIKKVWDRIDKFIVTTANITSVIFSKMIFVIFGIICLWVSYFYFLEDQYLFGFISLLIGLFFISKKYLIQKPLLWLKKEIDPNDKINKDSISKLTTKLFSIFLKITGFLIKAIFIIGIIWLIITIIIAIGPLWIIAIILLLIFLAII